MKPDLSSLDDQEYEHVVSLWEEYAGITTAELMEKYDTTEADAIGRYAKEEVLLTLEQHYHLYDCTWELWGYLSRQEDFKEACSCDNFEWALEMFITLLESDMAFNNLTYFMPEPDLGISWFAVNTPTDRLYLNLDEIWHYWVGLNKENYFNL